MKKIITIALALVLGFLAVTLIGGQAAEAETNDDSKDGTVFRTGAVGLVTVDPDIAYLTVGASSERDNAADAMEDVNLIMDDVLAAVKAAGVADEDIKTQHIGVDVIYDYSRSTRMLQGYMARNSLTVTIRNLDDVAVIYDAVIEAGANDVGSLAFDKENKDEAYDEALALAVARATEKVDVLAAAAGIDSELIPQTFEEVSYQTYAGNVRQMDMAVEEASGVNVIPGTLEIVASVAVEFKTAD